jgi:hypothetical protein
MSKYANAFDAVHSVVTGHPMPEQTVAEASEPKCQTCEGGGWICYGLGFGDPHFRECESCYNPKGWPKP